jgi:N-acetylmuramoyl-L-alanine amidase
LGSLPVNAQHYTASNRAERKAMRRSSFFPEYYKEWRHLGNLIVDSIRIDKDTRTADYYLNPAFTQMPIRDSMVNNLKKKIISKTGRVLKNYTVNLHVKGLLLEEYVPNAFRVNRDKDPLRFTRPPTVGRLIIHVDKPQFNHGLTGSHIALWPSHGLFYDQQLDKWKWQRARLWQTVEDIFPWSFSTAYLIPMLENSGATVLMPRERDTQIHEVMVDNDYLTGGSKLLISNGKSTWDDGFRYGFGYSDTLFPGSNPFLMGTGLALHCDGQDTASLTYVPEIQETGEYAVYVSYVHTADCAEKVQYEVKYSGGTDHFIINQCMGAGTWIYLGTYRFKKGIYPESGSVVVTAKNSRGMITSDAVRFGGGMGNSVRRPLDSIALPYSMSGRPRWMEGARYYLQYAGMPDTLVYSINKGKTDYNDDYMSRPEWVNYLIGNSRPQYNSRYDNGLNIPVDLSLAFHTDAGVTDNDSVVGTLGIFSTVRNNSLFPDGRSKLASRDLTDIIQTQIVNDIRILYNPGWTRRGLWDREYSEAWRPVVPTMLLELLSHQNMADMRLGLDPRFKFDVARSIYKGILRYYANSIGMDNPVIQPLPPDHMRIEVVEGKKIRLSWKPVHDPVEPAAFPTGYYVYCRTEDQGFSQGIPCNDTGVIIELPEWDSIYSFKVTAINDGGESFPGEVLAVCLRKNNPYPVLIVNGFDRISGPSFFDKGDMAGISWWDDEGVPMQKEMSVTGYQYNFNRNSEWLSDENQGWGASSADFEATQISGNTFDFPYIHGISLRDAGLSFVSVSDEVFESPDFNVIHYKVIDVIFGEEKGIRSFKNTSAMEFRLFTPGFMAKAKQFAEAGGNMLISGTYVGTDMASCRDSAAIKFAASILHFSWLTDHATKAGKIYATRQGEKIIPANCAFNTWLNDSIYRVESPDGIEPAGKNAFGICRYSSGDVNAGVAYQGSYRCVILGFPIETLDISCRTRLMKSIMQFLNFNTQN